MAFECPDVCGWCGRVPEVAARIPVTLRPWRNFQAIQGHYEMAGMALEDPGVCGWCGKVLEFAADIPGVLRPWRNSWALWGHPEVAGVVLACLELGRWRRDASDVAGGMGMPQSASQHPFPPSTSSPTQHPSAPKTSTPAQHPRGPTASAPHRVPTPSPAPGPATPWPPRSLVPRPWRPRAPRSPNRAC